MDNTKLLRSSHKDNIKSFDSGFKFYLVRSHNTYVLAINNKDNSYIEKIKYSLSGVIITRVVDKVDSNNNVIRV